MVLLGIDGGLTQEYVDREGIEVKEYFYWSDVDVTHRGKNIQVATEEFLNKLPKEEDGWERTFLCISYTDRKGIIPFLDANITEKKKV